MKFEIDENKTLEFLAGIIMLAVGLYLLIKRVYVSTPMFSTGNVTIAGVRFRTGIFTIPVIAGLVWMFFKPEGKLPKILTVLGFVLILAVVISSVSIRVSRISLGQWVLIMFLIVAGLVLVLRAVDLKRKKD